MAKNKVETSAYGWSYNGKGGVAVGFYGATLGIGFDAELTVEKAKELRKQLKKAIKEATE